MELKVLLLDIEGTTTPISFVHDVLFPYARTQVGEFLRSSFDDPGVAADREALGREMNIDGDSIEALLGAVEQLMDEDRKSTPLKSLQGKIWKHGYADGTLQATVFDDVPGVLRQVEAAGRRICIYSSGSVAAQKLLFRYTTMGDLTSLIDAYFDTTTGPKKDASSYTTIANALHAEPRAIMFCTDNLDEARAAHEAGLFAVVIERPGNAPVKAHEFETWATLDPVLHHL